MALAARNTVIGDCGQPNKHRVGKNMRRVHKSSKLEKWAKSNSFIKVTKKQFIPSKTNQ